MHKAVHSDFANHMQPSLAIFNDWTSKTR